jgi:uncharacterized membrane protein YedE/YeeE
MHRAAAGNAAVPEISISAGFVIGLAFGIVGLLSGFCLTSGLRNWWGGSDSRKIRSYAIALATAILGTQFIAGAQIADIGKSLYLQPSFSVPLIFAGGVLFGLGMVLANGCASRALVLLGKGNLRSLAVVSVIAVTAPMTLKGLIAPLRLAVLQATQTTPAAASFPGLLAEAGVTESVARVAVTLIVVVGLVVFAFSERTFRRAYGMIAAGVVIGALVCAGWLTTGWLAADEFDPIPVTSLTFVSPAADTLQYAMLSTGLSANFGVALVVGVLSGSLLTALLTGRFSFEGYNSPDHMLRSICGAALMGIGGAMAYGCSIGQGLTGMSTLSLSSFVAAAGIVSGAALALRRRAAVPAIATR